MVLRGARFLALLLGIPLAYGFRIILVYSIHVGRWREMDRGSHSLLLRLGLVLGKSLNLLNTKFPHQWNGDNNSPCFIVRFWELKEIIPGKRLAPGKGTRYVSCHGVFFFFLILDKSDAMNFSSMTHVMRAVNTIWLPKFFVASEVGDFLYCVCSVYVIFTSLLSSPTWLRAQ